MRTLASIVVVMTLAGCSKSIPIPSSDNVKVGMTYSEVEEIFGKPTAIQKGTTLVLAADTPTPEFGQFNEALHKVDPSLSLELLGSLHLQADADSTFRSNELMIGQQGELVQTVWFLPNSPIKNDTLVYNTAQLDSVDAKRYWVKQTFESPSADWKLTSAKAYRAYSSICAYKTDFGPLPVVRIKKIKYVVHYVFAIVFDSSSGRVASCGYLPTTISRL